mmetsp:Transcript_13871/g.55918  ORF Transcript_13871/g.55918 Transcript_13871/m.55918 type:complete len:432 (-) Transcript_13871:328-1623(-)|eukprot:CAMPEP_0113958402 /NCGR_PEP_ID=MMETSP0011_2-20120614/3401_1 /TAXON_ID=101924 /ORGANISM="Rhodosorus marinus" /LENGTH=431 /DNA_ID=CAMNT_0000969263 /DNA_START=112 /DNA_END=1407 /DNA_ORIENTATION=- /assembly_acc=CAM_ASM_000156
MVRAGSGTALALSCLISVGAHYGKHALSALGPELMSELQLNKRQFGLIFSAQELPGIILPLYAGIVVGTLQPHVAAVVLTSAVFVGQALVNFSVRIQSYYTLLLGRVVFGLGDGSLVVLQGFIIGKWFAARDPEDVELLEPRRKLGLSTAYGIMLLSSRLSSFTALASPAMISSTCDGGLMCALQFALIVCGISLVAGLAFWWFFGDYYGSDWSGARSLRGFFRIYNFEYVLLVSIWMLVSAAFFSFIHFAPALFFERYRFSAVDSGFISSLCLGLAALVSPFLGCLLDRVGRRPDALISGSLLMSGAMFMLLLPSAEMEVFIAVALLGSGFALAPVTLLSSVALVTDEANLAPALGVFKSCENLSMALAHYVAGLLVDVSGGYSWTLMFLKVLCLWAVACAFILRRYDRKEGGKLMIVKATAKTGPESQT